LDAALRRRSHPKTTSGTGMPVKNTTALVGSGTAANDVEAPNTSFAFGELLSYVWGCPT